MASNSQNDVSMNTFTKDIPKGASRILIVRVGILLPIRIWATRLIDNSLLIPESPTNYYPFSAPATLYFPNAGITAQLPRICGRGISLLSRKEVARRGP